MDTTNPAAFGNGQVLPNFIGKKVRTMVQVNQSDGVVIKGKPHFADFSLVPHG